MAKKKTKSIDTTEGVGLHRKPTCVEIVMSQTGMPFLKVNSIVKEMTKDEKAAVDTKEKDKVSKAVGDAYERYLDKNKATSTKSILQFQESKQNQE